MCDGVLLMLRADDSAASRFGEELTLTTQENLLVGHASVPMEWAPAWFAAAHIVRAARAQSWSALFSACAVVRGPGPEPGQAMTRRTDLFCAQAAGRAAVVSRSGRRNSPGAWLRCVAPAVAGSWNGSWNGSPGNPSAGSAVSAITCVIGAASACGARGRASHNPPVVGSSPTRPTCSYPRHLVFARGPVCGPMSAVRCMVAATSSPPTGHVEQLSSGSPAPWPWPRPGWSSPTGRAMTISCRSCSAPPSTRAGSW
jgi:hypothetical protein